jgi:hypothetical protein
MKTASGKSFLPKCQGERGESPFLFICFRGLTASQEKPIIVRHRGGQFCAEILAAFSANVKRKDF